MVEHGQERDHARATGDELERATHFDLPDEPAAERASDLQFVAGPELIGQVRGDLAVRQSVDDELDVRAPRAPRRSSSCVERCTRRAR